VPQLVGKLIGAEALLLQSNQPRAVDGSPPNQSRGDHGKRREEGEDQFDQSPDSHAAFVVFTTAVLPWAA